MKKIETKIFPLYLALLIVILLTSNVFVEGKSYNLYGENSLIENANEGEDQTNLEVEKNNKEIAKIIKEKIGIDVEVKDGILSYDLEKAISMRNSETAKAINKAHGIILKVMDGTIYIDREKVEDSNKYKLPGISFEAITKPNTLLLDYPYENEQIEAKNYSYSKYLFKLNTKFSSQGKNFYHADFYSQNDSYMFTISGNNVDDMYNISLNINKSDIHNCSDNDINSYYIIMYSDDKAFTTQDIYYFVDYLSR